ncbi:serine/arginine repetitive matrix protein 2-like [Sphaeramia orbicularis]|uniref:serine/arginine repetitive matrix protein 2-like n=1 Tax=Sphaeramia orbicularis TaxID=375764 RepID=UPI001180DD81|nr:serine/arginine repetitive matrix protein 2-like [Sphaeramia orbicularis]
MRVPASVAAVSCLCPLVVFLCVISQSCYGTQVDLSPHANPNPSLYPNPRHKSLPEPSPVPNSNKEPAHMSSVKRGQLGSSNHNTWNKPHSETRVDSNPSHTDNYRSNANFPSAVSQATTSLNARLKLQLQPKHVSNSRQGLVFKTNSNLPARNSSNIPKESSKSYSRANPKQRLGSLLQTKPKAVPNSKAGNKPKTNSESLSKTKISSISSPNVQSNSSGKVNPNPFSGSSAALVSGSKSHSKVKSSSLSNARADSKVTNPNVKTPIRSQRNQTKFLDTDKDTSHRPKRGWIWNQFFVLEEHIGPEPQYVGKV